MAKVTVMSYRDTNAPQIVGNNRTAFYSLLDVWMKDGYNKKFVKNLYTRPDRTIVLEYAAPHGYKQGHLIKLTGATDPLFNNKFRCLSATADTLVLRLDKDDAQTYPTTDTSTAIESVVAPADWQQVYSGNTQRTYRSKNTTKSSQLYYTFKEPTNPNLKTAGACCYSVDISKEFDVATGGNLNSIFESQKSTTDGTNFYVITDYYTTPITNVNNGKCGIYLPWFVVATDTFVYFLVGARNNNTTTTNPTFDDQFKNWNRIDSLYACHQYYFFGDFVPYNELEYTQKTSGCFSFYKYIQQTNYSDTVEIQKYPCINMDYNGSFNITDTYVPAGSYTSGSVRQMMTYGTSYSGALSNYLTYPSYNITGLLCTTFYIFQQNSTAANNPNYMLRGQMPLGTYVSNSFQLFKLNSQEGNPFILESSGNVYDEMMVMLSSNYGAQYGSQTSSGTGYSFFTLD